MNYSLLIVICFLFLATYAWVFEKNEQEHTYIGATPSYKDSPKNLFHKLKLCLTFEERTVKWRRSLLSACLLSGAIFIFIYRVPPTPSQLLTVILIAFAIYYFMWNNYVNTTVHNASKIGQQLLFRLKKSINRLNASLSTFEGTF